MSEQPWNVTSSLSRADLLARYNYVLSDMLAVSSANSQLLEFFHRIPSLLDYIKELEIENGYLHWQMEQEIGPQGDES